VHVFPAVNASLRWLNKVTGVYLVHVSLLLIGQQGLGHFFRYCFPLAGGLSNIFRQRHRKTTNTVQHQPLLVQYKHQANPLVSMHNYTPLVINKQLTILSQCKLALTEKNTIFAL
jgi:hypothetical protein